MLMRSLVVTVFLYFVVSQTQAFTLFNLDSSKFSRKKTTDVFIVGFGDSAGDQFVRSALTRAAKHAEMNPANQQLFIWATERSKEKDLSYLKNKGIRAFESNRRDLTEKEVFRYLKKIRTIQTLHMFTHNAAWQGAGLQERTRLNYNSSGWTEIKSRIKGYVFLHGCNTGFIYAPKLSKRLGVPVFGSLGSTDFQQLHKDGLWYHNNKGQYPEGGWSYRNGLSYITQKSCQGGFCHRLQPDMFHYSGLWGSYKTGLPFYKAFCNFSRGSSRMKKCNAALVDALKTWPSTHSERLDNWNSIEKKLVDFLCPIHASLSARNNCLESLNAYRNGRHSSATTYYGNDTNCYLSGCDLKLKNILRGDKKAYVKGFFSKDNNNKSLVREYQLYKDAFSGVTKRHVRQASVTIEK